jgi:hypothetical protein
MKDAFLYPVQVLQQPDARTAMDGRDKQPYFADTAVGKLQEAGPDLFIVKVCILLAYFRLFYFDARVVLNFIIFAGIAFFQDLINRFASRTAKGLFVKDHRVACAIFTAMITAYFGGFIQSSSS